MHGLDAWYCTKMEENSNPLQYSCLGNPMDRGAWWAILHGVAESDMTEWLSMRACTHTHTHTHSHYCSPLVYKPPNSSADFISKPLLCFPSKDYTQQPGSHFHHVNLSWWFLWETTSVAPYCTWTKLLSVAYKDLHDLATASFSSPVFLHHHPLGISTTLWV